MLVDFVQHINWLYVLMIAILIRIIYIGVVNGFVVEFFKLIGVLFVSCVAFHYYPVIANSVHNRVPMFSLDNWQAFYFCVLWFVTVVIFRLIREGLLLLFKVDAHPVLDQWGGAVVAVIRGVLICSLTMYALVLTDLAYIEKVPSQSLTKRVVMPIAPGIYTFTFHHVIKKLFPDEQINMHVVALVKSRGKKPH